MYFGSGNLRWKLGKQENRANLTRKLQRKKKNFQNKNPLFHSRVYNERESLRFCFCLEIFFLYQRPSVLEQSVILLIDRAKRNSVKRERAFKKEGRRRCATSSSRFTNRGARLGARDDDDSRVPGSLASADVLSTFHRSTRCAARSTAHGLLFR